MQDHIRKFQSIKVTFKRLTVYLKLKKEMMIRIQLTVILQKLEAIMDKTITHKEVSNKNSKLNNLSKMLNLLSMGTNKKATNGKLLLSLQHQIPQRKALPTIIKRKENFQLAKAIFLSKIL